MGPITETFSEAKIKLVNIVKCLEECLVSTKCYRSVY